MGEILREATDFPSPSPLSAPSPSTSPTLQGLPEDHALCFFFNQYVLPQRDPLARRGFLEYTLPIYSKSGPHSPLKLSITAVATSFLSGAMNQGDDPPLARAFYLGAVQRMKELISESKECANDELIMAVMLLQMYEASCPQISDFHSRLAHTVQKTVGRTKKTVSAQAHLDGALALIRHRGVGNFKSEVSRALLYYVRSVLVSPLPQWMHAADTSGRGMPPPGQAHTSRC
jgi:hypothetical protein